MTPIKVEKHGNVRWRVLVKQPNGKYSSKFFEDLQTANAFCLSTGGDSIRQFLLLTDIDRARLVSCLHRAGGIEPLEQMVDRYVKARPTEDKLFWAAAEECAAVKEKSGKSPLYVSNLLTGLRHLERAHPNRTVASFTTSELQVWLDGAGWAAETKRTFLARVETFFGWAQKRGYCTSNPAEGCEAPEWVPKRPVIMTVDEVYKLLSTCLALDPGMSHYFAIALFAGVRPSECRRLRQEHVVEDFLEIEAKSSKVRARRLVAIEGNLKEWLDLKEGEMPPTNWRRRFRRIVDAAKITWTPDVLRHSFCSYAISLKGATWTAAHAGNSEGVLHRHYRELVRPKEAVRYFEITPDRVREWRASSLLGSEGVSTPSQTAPCYPRVE